MQKQLKNLTILSIILLFFLLGNSACSINSNSEEERVSENDNSAKTITIETMPKYKGGLKKLQSFLKENIKYPSFARYFNIEGKVYVKFVIDETGKVTKVKVAKGANFLLDREALRVVESIPDWTPGKSEGKNVPVTFTLPINFTLN